MNSEYLEEMNRRIASGEFGNPVDMYKVNAAWAEIMDGELVGHAYAV